MKLMSDLSRSMIRMLFCALALLFLAFPLPAQEVLKDGATKLTTDLLQPQKIQALKNESIVIAEFENINGKGDAVPRIFQEKLTTAFIKADHFDVVERAQLEKALKEMKIDSSGLTDPDNRRQLGKLLGAKYIVVGSISETNGQVSIDARIVAIETGKSLSAADVNLSANGASATGANPSPAAKPTTPSVDMNQPANPTGTGTMLGKVENGGLLGGGKFKQVWRVPIGNKTSGGILGALIDTHDGGQDRTDIIGFCAGNLHGDGAKKLVTVSVSYRDYGKSGYQYTGDQIQVWGWRSDCFRSLWKSESLQHANRTSVGCLRLINQDNNKPSAINYSTFIGFNPISYCYIWNGTTYNKIGKENDVMGLFVTESNNSKPVAVGIYNQRLMMMPTFQEEISSNNIDAIIKTIDKTVDPNTSYISAADLDGDGQLEFALAHSSETIQPIEIFGVDGVRKAVTEKGYGGRVTWWKPEGVKFPYLVTRINEFVKEDDNIKLNGGFVYLLQWNGENYDEVWKSDKINDYIIDMQVCDPKGEGKDGLVLLSRDKNGSYLTKINAD